MGRYVGNKWVESLPSAGPEDQVQGNSVPVPSSGGGGGGGGGSSAPSPAPSPVPSSSGTGGGGSFVSPSYAPVGSLTASDGQTLSSQDPGTIASFQAVYGGNAEQAWVQQHNQAIGASSLPLSPTYQQNSPIPSTVQTNTGGTVPNPAATGGGSGGGGGGGQQGGQQNQQFPWGEYFNAQQQQLLQTQAQNAADNAYREKYLSLIDVPMLDIQRQQAAIQAAQQAATAAYQQGLIQVQNRALDIQNTYQTALIAAQNRGLDIQQAANLANEAAQNRALDIQQEQTQQQGALGALNLVAQLQGPKNAFQQQAVISGINQSGLSNSVANLGNGQTTQPATQQQFAAPQAANLSSLIEQVTGIKPAAMGAASSANPSFQSVLNAPAPNSTSQNPNNPGYTTDTNAYTSALVAPQKIVSRNFNQQLPSSQQFDLSAYQAGGYSPDDVQNIIQRNNPQFAAPQVGVASI